MRDHTVFFHENKSFHVYSGMGFCVFDTGKAIMQIKVFENQAYQKPERKKIQPDIPAYTETGPVIIPGNHLFFVQKLSGKIFSCVNQQSIDDATEKDRKMVHYFIQGAQKGSAAINRKHPDGCVALQAVISSLQHS